MVPLAMTNAMHAGGCRVVVSGATPESQKIAGLVCVYNEKVDLIVDGQLLERPKTKFS